MELTVLTLPIAILANLRSSCLRSGKSRFFAFCDAGFEHFYSHALPISPYLSTWLTCTRVSLLNGECNCKSVKKYFIYYNDLLQKWTMYVETDKEATQVTLHYSSQLCWMFDLWSCFLLLSSAYWTSDPAMKQFLLYLDEKMALGKKFILKDLDDTHLFILAEVVHTLQERVGELMDQNSFPITQK